MRVKKIELLGFKSFADRTQVELHPGFTCIVGPNGCGKSNISDALRWVFGERSAKLLRGTRMEDVIFSGSDFRKPMGIAEVSLTIDNADHALPIAYDEVVITRRMDRSGQSQYFINKTQCRLRDIMDLLLDTGMGSNSYSMIEQGRVDHVINSDPSERRFLIEEAAGISKYKVKKEEALRKLERTEQNQLRIRDIVAEVERNIQYAERQARRAERYKTQFDNLKKLETQKAFLDLSVLGREKTEDETRQREIQGQREELEKSLEEILAREEAERKGFDATLEEEGKRSAHYYEVRALVQSVAQKREFDQERLRESEHRQIEIDKEAELIKGNLAELERELAKKITELKEAVEAETRVRETLEKEVASFQEKEAEFKSEQASGEGIKVALFENASELSRVRNETGRLRTLLEAGRHEEGRRKGNWEKLASEKEAIEKRRLISQEEICSLSRELERVRGKIEETQKSLSEFKEELNAFEGEAGQEKAKLLETLSRLKLLEELEESAEESERKLFESFSRTRVHGKLVKRLRDVLKIERGYESAVEAVLGSFAQGLVAEDVETAQGLIQEMGHSHLGPCGIFIQSLAKPNGKHTKNPSISHPQVKHAVQEVVQIQQGFEPLFHSLFENVYVVENFSAENLGEFLPFTEEIRLVTKQGILLGPESRIFFRNGRISQEQGSFHRKAEIESLRGIRQELDESLKRGEDVRKAKEKAVSERLEQTGAFQSEERDHLIRKEATESLLRGLEDRILHVQEELHVLGFESKDSHQDADGARKRLYELQTHIEELEEKEKKLSIGQEEKARDIEGRRQGREEQQHTLVRLNAFLENHAERAGGIEASQRLLAAQLEKAKERLEKIGLEGEALKQRIQEIGTEGIDLAKRGEVLTEEERQAADGLAEIRGRKGFQEEALRKISETVSEAKEKVTGFREALHRAEMKVMDLSYKEKTIFDRMEQAYNVRLGELRVEESLTEDLDGAELESRISELKGKVEAFGAVNLLAVEEYEELKQRYEFLSGQEKDLVEARESLLEAIRKINRTTKTLFEETFNRAKTLFQEYYQTLFGGGQGDLLLVEGPEGEEPGVDIVVRPPGKKTQHISLLSGGEKSLTAIALLFALFRIKPSPLCVLDEVDAALDESNVDRFLKVLKTFVELSQFLVVTHNRKTIATGDYLYGVTMEECGVSKIVSVRVGEAPETQKHLEREAVVG